ncbi:MAG TPA: hypothetical protein VMW01_00660 [Williamwhitmania sp.]|nr:hypothetical protein [Williamwhitmania sp.]
MEFEVGHLYHIYNQGNNRRKVFFVRDNYLFFLNKMKHHLLPYADILAWCLMPNHFHIMVHVNHVSLSVPIIDGVTPSHPVNRERTLNESIGIMLRSYTRAINKGYNRSGALFREETKAICLTKNDKLSAAWFTSLGVTNLNVDSPESQYPNQCFRYILSNPLRAGLVKSAIDWEFSSYLDFVGQRDGQMISSARIKEFGLTL